MKVWILTSWGDFGENLTIDSVRGSYVDALEAIMKEAGTSTCLIGQRIEGTKITKYAEGGWRNGDPTQPVGRVTERTRYFKAEPYEVEG